MPKELRNLDHGCGRYLKGASPKTSKVKSFAEFRSWHCAKRRGP